MKALENRIDKLEHSTATAADVPYITMTAAEWVALEDPDTPADVRAAIEGRYAVSRPTKLYIGISPDDFEEIDATKGQGGTL